MRVNLSQQLKTLAQGINPDTGEILEIDSVANSPEAIRLLFLLAEEIADHENPKKRETKLTSEEMIEKNIAEGRPAKSHFPWSEEDKLELIERYKKEPDIKMLADVFERSVLAIAAQLERAGIISEEDISSY